jgi:hypothetical protein
MPATRKITHRPAGKAMTIAELEAAIADARAAGATGSDVPKVRILFGGAIKELSIEVTENAPAAVEDTAR